MCYRLKNHFLGPSNKSGYISSINSYFLESLRTKSYLTHIRALFYYLLTLMILVQNHILNFKFWLRIAYTFYTKESLQIITSVILSRFVNFYKTFIFYIQKLTKKCEINKLYLKKKLVFHPNFKIVKIINSSLR
jgi:hypothetical protein